MFVALKERQGRWKPLSELGRANKPGSHSPDAMLDRFLIRRSRFFCGPQPQSPSMSVDPGYWATGTLGYWATGKLGQSHPK